MSKKSHQKNTSSKSKTSPSKIAAGAAGIALATGVGGYTLGTLTTQDIQDFEPQYSISSSELQSAKSILSKLPLRLTEAEIPDYDSKSMPGWSDVDHDGCPTRYDVLVRDLLNEKTDEAHCKIQSGAMFDYYTGNILKYNRLVSGGGIDIDHIVAKGNAWLSGGYKWADEDSAKWKSYVNDEDVLIATSSSVNRRKGDKDAASWLPPNEDYHCKYVIQQILIKGKYSLTVSPEEKNVMSGVLSDKCVIE